MTEPMMLLFSVAFRLQGPSETPEIVIFTEIPAVTPDGAVIKALTEKLDDARKLRVMEIRVARSARFDKDKLVYADNGELYVETVDIFWRQADASE